jgi:urea transport system substrate-binding protein
MRRWLIALAVIVALAGLAISSAMWFRESVLPIRVGLLHSKSGPVEMSERSMIDAELLAIEEINKAGFLGRLIEPVVADGKSDWPTFGREAERLIDEEKVHVLFGCWTSASRKSVKAVVEQKAHLLIYPMAYEGLEQSPNIIYTGAAPNQQVVPALSWCHTKLKARKFFLIGSDYIWPHCVNEIAKDQLNALGAECVGESYILFGSSDVGPSIAAIRKANPDVIISTVVGTSNKPFYQQLRSAGILPERTPVLSFSIAEDELRKLPLPVMIGDYAAWNYFQSIDRPENKAFIQRFRRKFGADRVTSDTIEAAYNSVWLWARAVLEAGSAEIPDVIRAMRRQSLNAPEGIVTVDEETQHTWRPVNVGKIRADGQFDLVWSSEKPIRPIPYPRSRSHEEWNSLLEKLHQRWGGWANPGTGREIEQSSGDASASRSSLAERDSTNGKPPAQTAQ